MALGPLTWNATTIAESGATRTTDFRGKWTNWRDAGAGGIWKAIDPSFESVGGKFVSSNSPWIVECPATATGAIRVVNRQSWNVHAKAADNSPEMEFTLTHPTANNVSGTIIPGRHWQVVYPNAIQDGIDIVGGIWHGRGPRAEHVYVIRAMPPGDSDYVPIECEISAPGRWLPIQNAVSVPITNGISARLQGDERRSISIRPTVAWYYDAGGKLIVVPISAEVRRIKVGQTKLTKYVPRSLIATALAARPGGELRVDTTSTFYPDADAETTSVDGYVEYYDAAGVTWATVHDAASGTATSDDGASGYAGYVSDAATDRWESIDRPIFLFDTSAIPDTDTISAADFSLYCPTKTNGFSSGSPAFNVFSSAPASNTSLANGDYSTCGTTAFATEIAYSSLSTGAFNTWSLNASGLAAIPVNGVAKFSWRESTYDAPNSAPPWTGSKFMLGYFYSADFAGTTSDPKLVVTHAAGGAAGPVLFHAHYMSQGIR